MLVYENPDTIDLADVQDSVACLASGGVDSSVAIHLLCERGFKPDLFYIKIGMESEDGAISCPAEEDIEMATIIARKYGLKLEVADLHKHYWDKVVAYTIESVRQGLTPNPDVMCNKLIKFGVFNDLYGDSYKYIATGHYATTHFVDGKVFLGTSPDPVKDQTDFLAQISFAQLSKLMFPIGRLYKSQVRQIAEDAHLINAKRKDSQGICFLGKINYNDFLERYLGCREGKIVEFETGKILGKHRGFWFHTIGQRKGLGLSGGPWYVVRKDVAENVIYVSGGYDPATQYGTLIETNRMDFITEDPFTQEGASNPMEVTFKVRHTPEFTSGLLYRDSSGYRLQSSAPIQGIAPGQYVVVYTPDRILCLGSGQIIHGE